MEPVSWKIIISFIFLNTSGHGYAVADARYSTMELCAADIPAAEDEARRTFARSYHTEVELHSECVIDIKDTDKRAS